MRGTDRHRHIHKVRTTGPTSTRLDSQATEVEADGDDEDGPSRTQHRSIDYPMSMTFNGRGSGLLVVKSQISNPVISLRRASTALNTFKYNNRTNEVPQSASTRCCSCHSLFDTSRGSVGQMVFDFQNWQWLVGRVQSREVKATRCG